MIYYDSNQIYGATKIYAILKDQGEAATVVFVRELMLEMGLQSIRIGSKKRHYDYDETRKCQNIVNRNFRTEHEYSARGCAPRPLELSTHSGGIEQSRR